MSKGDIYDKDGLGISVTLPNPGRKALKAATVCNFIVGAGLLATGIAFSSKCCAVLGGIEVISSVVSTNRNYKC